MNETVLITGSSRGIGRAAAILFAERGYRVVINYFQSEEAALSLSRQLNEKGCRTLPIRCDVSDRDQVRRMVEETEKAFGPIDILVNNAGIAEMKLFTDITPEYWERIFAVNVKGIFHCCQAVVPSMVSRKSGRIINISSIWGMVGASCETHYSATKGAILAFTKALAKELGPSGIRVNAIAPGAVYTDMIAGLDPQILEQVKAETPLGVIGSPEEVAETIFFAASQNAALFTGQILSPNGGLVIT
ncbi:MAG: 3-oxoacyl-ACP reductase FabG [Peptostreptococcaceae bacterium]|nr:3-oxoacyl-ACP reductase FabG [Peptostreptococcaceae bacterium]